MAYESTSITLGSVHKYFGGGWAKWRGGQKSFELPEGGTKKFSVVKGGSKKFSQMESNENQNAQFVAKINRI